MRTFFAFVRKEFYHILRDRRTLIILLGMPVVQIIIFGFALTNEVKNTRIAILNQSGDETSIRLQQEVEASRYFDVKRTLKSSNEIEKVFREGSAKMVLVIPQSFGNDLRHSGHTTIQLLADASDPNLATTVVNYASSIIRDFQTSTGLAKAPTFKIEPEVRMLYNPQLQGAYSFVPGVMAMVLMLVCTMMTAITIVREKEMGTMEIMLVSPVKPFGIVTAKAVPYLLLSLINVASILLLSSFVLDVPIRGNLFLLIGESVLFILTCLALGLLISSSTASQQTAMFISLTGMLLPTIMLSGFMFPIENMPTPLRVVSNIVPAKWYYQIVSDIMIKGTGWSTVWKETMILVGMTMALLALAVKKFKIRLA
jgi:ABC-2 type transport system permease protein